MRYLSFISMREGIDPPPQALIEAMDAEIKESFANGTLIDCGGLYGTEDATEVRLAAGTATRTDGPFAEGKEVVGGWSILEVRDHAEAVEGARRVIALHQELWPGWEGSVVVRRVSEFEDGPPRRG